MRSVKKTFCEPMRTPDVHVAPQLLDMDDATRRATLKRDKTGLLKSFLAAGFWEMFGDYLKNAAAATYRGPL